MSDNERASASGPDPGPSARSRVVVEVLATDQTADGWTAQVRVTLPDPNDPISRVGKSEPEDSERKAIAAALEGAVSDVLDYDFEPEPVAPMPVDSADVVCYRTDKGLLLFCPQEPWAPIGSLPRSGNEPLYFVRNGSGGEARIERDSWEKIADATMKCRWVPPAMRGDLWPEATDEICIRALEGPLTLTRIEKGEPVAEYGWPKKGDVVRNLSNEYVERIREDIPPGGYIKRGEPVSDAPQWQQEGSDPGPYRYRRLQPASEQLEAQRPMTMIEQILHQSRQAAAMADYRRTTASYGLLATPVTAAELAAQTHSQPNDASCPTCHGTRSYVGTFGQVNHCSRSDYHGTEQG